MAENNETARSPSRETMSQTMSSETAELSRLIVQQLEDSARLDHAQYETVLRDVLRQVETVMLHRYNQNSINSGLKSSSRSELRYETSEKITKTETSEAVSPPRGIDALPINIGRIARATIILLACTVMATICLSISSGVLLLTRTRSESHIMLQEEILDLRQRVQELEQNTLKAFEKSARAIEQVATECRYGFHKEVFRSQP